MGVSFKDADRLRALFTGAQARMKAAILSSLEQVGRKLEAEAKKRAPVSAGILRSSIAHQVSEAGILEVGILTAPGGNPLVYGRIQDLGGTVKGNPWLTIPLDAMKTKAGVGAIRAREAGVRFPGGTFFQMSRKGNLILFGKLGRTAKGRQRTKGFNRAAGDGVGPPSRERSSIVPLFVLKSQVTIKGNRYLTGAVADNLEFAASFIGQRVAAVMGVAA